MIQLKDVSLGYGSRRLLSGVNQEFDAGTLYALIGRNGTGKSTLMRAISGINRRYEGKIEIAGRDIRNLGAPEMSKLLALVTTERVRIEAMTSREVVAIGRSPYTGWTGRLSESDRRIVNQALAAVGMSDYAGRRLQTMSDGECQRVMVARAQAQDTPVILLDEPTSYLDMPSRYTLVRLLRSLAHNKDKCIIFSTHELDIATEECDQVALIDEGRLRVASAAEMRALLPQTSLFRDL